MQTEYSYKARLKCLKCNESNEYYEFLLRFRFVHMLEALLHCAMHRPLILNSISLFLSPSSNFVFVVSFVPNVAAAVCVPSSILIRSKSVPTQHKLMQRVKHINEIYAKPLTNRLKLTIYIFEMSSWMDPCSYSIQNIHRANRIWRTRVALL